MKLLTFVLILLIFSVGCRSQKSLPTSGILTTSEKLSVDHEQIKNRILPALNKQINQITLDPSESELANYQKFINDAISKQNLYFDYKVSLEKSQDILTAENSNTILGTNKSVRFGYICTDTRHHPRHSATTIREIKKLQQQNECTGIETIIVEE